MSEAAAGGGGVGRGKKGLKKEAIAVSEKYGKEVKIKVGNKNKKLKGKKKFPVSFLRKILSLGCSDEGDIENKLSDLFFKYLFKDFKISS